MTTAFNQTEFDLAYPDGVEHNYWSVARNAILHSTISSAKLDQVKWIEVGCGRGQVVKYLRSRGIDTTGVELADVKPLAGIETHALTNTDASTLPGKERFQAMMLLDVIEHIEDPKAFVRFLLGHYPNVRHLLVTVPARQEIWSNYDEFYGHFRRYSLQSLDKEVRDMGLVPARLHYFFHALYPVGRAVMALSGNRELKVSAPRGWERLLHRLIGSAFALESRIVPGNFAGTSLLCLAACGRP